MLKDATEILVEDHSQGETWLVNILVQAFANAHQNDLNDLLELIPWHLHLVKKAIRSHNFSSNNGQPPCRVSHLVGLVEATFDLSSAYLTLTVVSLGQELIHVVVHLLNYGHFWRYHQSWGKGLGRVVRDIHCATFATLRQLDRFAYLSHMLGG